DHHPETAPAHRRGEPPHQDPRRQRRRTPPEPDLAPPGSRTRRPAPPRTVRRERVPRRPRGRGDPPRRTHHHALRLDRRHAVRSTLPPRPEHRTGPRRADPLLRYTVRPRDRRSHPPGQHPRPRPGTHRPGRRRGGPRTATRLAAVPSSYGI